MELYSTLAMGRKLSASCEGLQTNPLKTFLSDCFLGGACYLEISESYRCIGQALGAASSSTGLDLK